MRACDPRQLAFKPFASDDLALAVAADGVARRVGWGGAGMLERRPVLTLYLPKDWGWPVGSELTVNILPASRRPSLDRAPASAGAAELRYEPSESIRPARIAEARLAFECRIVAGGPVAGLSEHGQLVVAEVLSAHQRWPRGCAIT